MRTRSWFCLVVSAILVVAGCDRVDASDSDGSSSYTPSDNGSAGGGSQPSNFRPAIATLSEARHADETAIKEIADATGRAGTCYETAANQYMHAAASYNAWISDMVASIEQGDSITELDLESAELQRAAAYSTLLRENADRAAQNNSQDFGMIVRNTSFHASGQHTLEFCPFVTFLARAAVEAAIGELVSRGLSALMDSRGSNSDEAQRESMIQQLEESRWSDLSIVLG
jgi:hypothetical protein